MEFVVDVQSAVLLSIARAREKSTRHESAIRNFTTYNRHVFMYINIEIDEMCLHNKKIHFAHVYSIQHP